MRRTLLTEREKLVRLDQAEYQCDVKLTMCGVSKKPRDPDTVSSLLFIGTVCGQRLLMFVDVERASRLVVHLQVGLQ